MNERESRTKRKISSTTSCSDVDQDIGNSVICDLTGVDNIVESDKEELERPNTNNTKSNNRGQKQKKKKQRTMDPLIEQKLNSIDEKLQKMLTKDDRNFVREIIKETIEEMKENLLSSINKKIEVLEHEVHGTAENIETMRNATYSIKSDCECQLEALNDKIGSAAEKLKVENKRLKESVNELEQYSRRNNIRIVGINQDDSQQSAAETTALVVSTLNTKLGIDISPRDIDIAHRVGKFDENKGRPIIVKFISRQTKIDIFSRTKKLKGTKIFINEDLTKLNHQVLMSLRLKDPNTIERAWAMDGKLFAAFKSTNPRDPRTRTRQIRYGEYNDWLDMPWPTRT